MIGFLCGIVSGIITYVLFTHEYLDRGEDVKFFLYSALIGMPMSIALTTLVLLAVGSH